MTERRTEGEGGVELAAVVARHGFALGLEHRPTLRAGHREGQARASPERSDQASLVGTDRMFRPISGKTGWCADP